MNLFYIDPVLNENKNYLDLFSDINSNDNFEYFIKESNTYKFFTTLLNKIVSNKDCCILDSDFSKDEWEAIKFENKCNYKEINEVCVTSFDDLINKIKSSSSEISIFTSGTTGKPKRIVHNIETLTRTIRKSKSNYECVWAFAYNPTHIAGLQVFFQALFNQNTLVNVFKQSRASIYDALDKFSITHISATPTFYRLLLPFEKEFVNVVRITFGGERSDSNLHSKLKTLFPNAKTTNIYASTELGTLLHSNGEFFQIPKDLQDDVLIKDNELYVSVNLLGKSESLEIENGMYKTGDMIEIVSLDPTIFKFLSRKSDYVNIGGYKVNLQEVEEVINSINGVRLSNVSVKSNSVLGNILIANIVVDRTNPLISEKFIRDFLKTKLQEAKIPRIIKFVNDIEYTRTGKLQK